MSDPELGGCGALEEPDGSIRWRVWAPRAQKVTLVLFEAGGCQETAPMVAQSRGVFSYRASQVEAGQRYAFRLDGGADLPDPASRWQPDGIHHPSAVLRTSRFEWSEAGWKGIDRSGLVFYELHVGTFTPQGTFEAVIPRLDTLRGLGVTAIELMPVGQFPGVRNWGYDGVSLAAPQNTYGGPQGLQRLVNACHQHGLAIFLDVVFNHLGPEGNYLDRFGPYFSNRYHTDWGPAFNYDGPGSDAVRQLVLDVVRLWIGTYRFDGLRLDAVHAIFDRSPRHILREIKEAAAEAALPMARPVHVVAESDLNDVRLLLAPDRGGYALDAQWSDDFHHSVHALITGERQGYYGDFGRPEDLCKALQQTFVFDGKYNRLRDRRHGGPAQGLPGDRFVVAIQNHDQVGNRARGDRLSTLLTPAQYRLAASLLLFAPHLPLIFMGEEYGEERPFPFFCSFLDAELTCAVGKGRREEFAAFAWQGEVPDPQSEATFRSAQLGWEWQENAQRAGIRRLYQDLLAARRSWPALGDFQHRSARLVDTRDRPPVLELVRGKLAGAVRVLFNLGGDFAAVPAAPGFDLLFTSEAQRYGGARAADESVEHMLPFECLAFTAHEP